MPFETLMAAVAIASANDAATAVAEHLADNEDQFVDRMNVEGERLGLTVGSERDAREIEQIVSGQRLDGRGCLR